MILMMKTEVCKSCGAETLYPCAENCEGEAGGCDWNFGRRPGLRWPPLLTSQWPPWYKGSTWKPKERRA